MRSATQHMRFFTWFFIVLFVLVGAGLYWKFQGKYQTKAGVTTSSPTIADNTLTTGLVGYWTFDRAHVVWADTTTEIKDTAGTNHGNALGSLAAGSLAVGKQGQALTFNGTSDYVDVADNASLDIDTTSLTIAFWMNVAVMPSGDVYSASRYKIVDKEYGGTGYGVNLGNNGTVFNLPGGPGWTQSTFTPVLNQWMHYVAVFDNTNNISRVYLDGALHDTATGQVGNLDQNDYSLRIGYKTYSGSDGTYFNGKLDDIRIYNRTLSASEVYQLYMMGTDRINAPPEDPLSQSLLGYWKMDEGTGTSTTADSSGNGNTLTMTNMESGDWVAGQAGPYSLDFDGTNEYLTIASPSSVLDFPAGASFSITGWFNRSRTYANDHTIISTKSGQSTESDGYIVWIGGGDDLLHFRADENGSTDARTIVSTTTFTSAGWHHFAVSWEDDRDVSLFIDGKSEGTPSGTTFANIDDLSNTNAFRIGAETDAGVPFDGNLDDIRVYGYPLSADQVLKLYQTTAPAQPVDTGLVGHWTFDGPDIKGTTAIDRSGKGNNGTITGAVPAIGKLGQGLSFNGTSDYISAPNSTTFTDLSVSAWVYPTITLTTDKYPTIVEKSGVFSLGYYCSSECIYGALFGGEFGWSTDVASLVPEWRHLVLTFNDAANRYDIYLNGSVISLTDNTMTSSLTSNSNPIRIGHGIDTSVQYFPGKIDDVRVYNRTLSASDVLALYNLSK